MPTTNDADSEEVLTVPSLSEAINNDNNEKKKERSFVRATKPGAVASNGPLTTLEPDNPASSRSFGSNTSNNTSSRRDSFGTRSTREKSRNYTPANKPGVVHSSAEPDQVQQEQQQQNSVAQETNDSAKGTSALNGNLNSSDNKVRTTAPSFKPGAVHVDGNEPQPASTAATTNDDTRDAKVRTTAPATRPGVVRVQEEKGFAEPFTAATAAASTGVNNFAPTMQDVKARTTAPATKPGVVHMDSVGDSNGDSDEPPMHTFGNGSAATAPVLPNNSNAKARTFVPATRPGVASVGNNSSEPVGNPRAVAKPVPLLPLSNPVRTTARLDRSADNIRHMSIHEPEPFVMEPTSSSSSSDNKASNGSLASGHSSANNDSQAKLRPAAAATKPGVVRIENSLEPGDASMMAEPTTVTSNARSVGTASMRDNKSRSFTPATKPGVMTVGLDAEPKYGALTPILESADSVETITLPDTPQRNDNKVRTTRPATKPGVVSVAAVSQANLDEEPRLDAGRGKTRNAAPATKPGVFAVQPEVKEPSEPFDIESTSTEPTTVRDGKVRTAAPATQPGIVQMSSAGSASNNESSIAPLTMRQDGKTRNVAPATKPGVMRVVEPAAPESPVIVRAAAAAAAASPQSTRMASEPGFVQIGSEEPTMDHEPSITSGRDVKSRPAVRAITPGVVDSAQVEDETLSNNEPTINGSYTRSKDGKNRIAEPATKPGVLSMSGEERNGGGAYLSPMVEPSEPDHALASSTSGPNISGENDTNKTVDQDTTNTRNQADIVALVEEDAMGKTSKKGKNSGRTVPGAVSDNGEKASEVGTVMMMEQDLHEKARGKGLRNVGATTPGVLRDSNVEADDPALSNMDQAAIVSLVEDSITEKSRGKVSGNLRLEEPGVVLIPGDDAFDRQAVSEPINSRSVSDSGLKERSVEFDESGAYSNAGSDDLKAKLKSDISMRNMIVDGGIDASLLSALSDEHRSSIFSAKSERALTLQKSHEFATVDEKDEKDEKLRDAHMKNADLEFGVDQNTNERLAIARPVEEDDEDEYLPAAIEYDPDSKPPIYRNRRFRLYSILCCVLAIAIIVAGVIIGSDKKGSENVKFLSVNGAPTAAPTSMGFVEFKSEISKRIGDKAASDKSYAMAENWITNVDPLQLSKDDPMFIQRFVLALLYYETTEQGESPWLTCNPPTDEEDDDCMFKNFTAVDDYGVVTYEDESAVRWLTGSNECDWPGVECYEDYVVMLRLRANNLQGTIPLELQLLPILGYLMLPFNQLTGTLAPEIASMKNLYIMELQGNLLEGQIPGELFNSEILRKLDLGNNMFTGSISTNIGKMTSMRGLFLYGNGLEGPLPDEFGNLSLLQYTRLQRNSFGGASIPSSWGKLRQLEELWILSSELGGTIPTELGSMTALTSLRLPDNRLTGPIPSQIGQLSNLDGLELQQNEMNGAIPSELYNCTMLTTLALHRNAFTGQLSSSIGQLLQLKYLTVHTNELTGPIPEEISELFYLITIWLYFNKFEGDVPKDICRLFSAGPLEYLNADCFPNDSPPNFCYCCTACCDRETGQCSDNVL